MLFILFITILLYILFTLNSFCFLYTLYSARAGDKPMGCSALFVKSNLNGAISAVFATPFRLAIRWDMDYCNGSRRKKGSKQGPDGKVGSGEKACILRINRVLICSDRLCPLAVPQMRIAFSSSPKKL